MKFRFVDITSVLSLGGNGVDLFFVISGFCMYYFYANSSEFTYSDFWQFLKKRWIRLSPAFYTATIVYVLINWREAPLLTKSLKILTSLLYVNSLSPHNVEGFFWSLGPEWQFYMVIPFVFIYQNKIGFFRTFAITGLTMLIISVFSVFILASKSDILVDQLIFRYFEFACGIVVARVILIYPVNLSHRWIWLIAFIILTYFGRFLISRYILSISPLYYNIFKLIGFTVMSSGFAGIIYLAITSKKWLKLLLGNKLISGIGKISYSFYLWHGIVHVLIGKIVIENFEMSGLWPPITTFTISTLILIPVSYLSYLILEKPFLGAKKHKTN